MKKSKIVLIMLEILLVIVVVSYNVFDVGKPKNIEHYIQKELKENQIASFNYTLKYIMPEGYEEVGNSKDEIYIANADNSSIFIANYFPIEKISIEDFFKIQKDVFTNMSFGDEEHKISDETKDETTVDNKTITKEIFKVNNSHLDVYVLVATIQFTGEDKFIGVVANVPSLDDEKDFNSFINNIEFTKQTTDKERIFANEDEPIKITIPPNWLRLEKDKNYSFYNFADEEGIVAVIESDASGSQRLEEEFNAMVDYLSSLQGISVVKDKEVSVVGKKTITTSVLGIKEQNIYNVISLITFEGSNTSTIAKYEVYTENIEASLKEVEKVTNSIELNKNYVDKKK